MYKAVFILATLLAISCSNSEPQQKMIMINYRSHGFSEIDKITVDNQVLITYMGDYTVYRTMAFNHNSGSRAKDPNIYLNDTTGTKLYSYYFINETDKEGLVFNIQKEWKKFDRDLFIKSNGLDFANYDFFKLDLGNPAAIEYDTSKNLMIEKYNNKLNGQNEPDSLYRYYDQRLKDIKFSFNKSFDSKTKSKLCKVGLIYNTSVTKNKQSNKIRREDYFMITLVDDPKEEAKILELLRKFKEKHHSKKSTNVPATQ